MKLLLTLLLLLTINLPATGKEHILATGQNGTEVVFPFDKMVYSNWLDNCVLWMPFCTNQSATTAYDYSKEGNDGTVAGATYVSATSTTSGYYSFSNITDKITDSDISDIFTGGTNTITFWMRRTFADDISVNSWQFYIYHSTDNRFTMYYHEVLDWWLVEYKAGGISSAIYLKTPTVIPQNAWTHIAIKYNKADDAMYIYLNGIAVASSASLGTWTGGSPTFCTVGNHYTGNNGFYGGIDEVRLYNIDLTTTEIQAIYNQDKSRHQ